MNRNPWPEGRPGLLPRAMFARGLMGVTLFAIIAVVTFILTRDNYHPVRPGLLYRSAQLSPDGIRSRAEIDGIRTIINLRGYWPKEDWYESERRACQDLGLAHFDVGLKTHQQPPIRELQRLVEILDTAPRPILVHCRWGADRTSLAVAIDQILHGGRTPREAMEEYQLLYGHTGWSWGHHLPHMFTFYEEALAKSGRPHSPDAFRKWVHSIDHLGYFAADLDGKPLPPEHTIGRPIHLKLRVANESEQVWNLRDPAERGIHVFLETKDLTTGQRCRHAARQPVGIIRPGQSFDVEFEVPPFHRPGFYRVRADLEDGHGLRFSEMGIGCWCQDIHVSDSMTTIALDR